MNLAPVYWTKIDEDIVSHCYQPDNKNNGCILFESEESGGIHMYVFVRVWEREIKPPTLCKEKVRTQKVASSMVSNRVTWVIP